MYIVLNQKKKKERKTKCVYPMSHKLEYKREHFYLSSF